MIGNAWRAAGGLSTLGYPTSDSSYDPVVSSAVMQFQHGTVYASSAFVGGLNAVISGPTWDKWQSLGGANGFLGRPLAAPASIPGGAVYTHFQGGDITSSARTGTHEVHGAIRDLWLHPVGPGGPYSLLGLPTSDEMDGPVAGSRVSHFENGSIYWSAATGAHSLFYITDAEYTRTAGMKDAYGTSVRSILGLPTSDEMNAPGGRVVHFQGGDIYSCGTAATTFAVYGAIRDRWLSLGGSGGSLGMPTSEEQDSGPGGRLTEFQGGTIVWSPLTGTRVGYRAEAQGGIGNCCFISSLAAVASSGVDLAARITKLSNNVYRVPLYEDHWYGGGWTHKDIWYDGTLTATDPAISDPHDFRQFWVVLYQRAYLALNGVDWRNDADVRDNARTSPDDAFKALTGHDTNDHGAGAFNWLGAGEFDGSDVPGIINALATGHSVVAQTRGFGPTDWGGGVTTPLLVGQHCYTVMAVEMNPTTKQYDLVLRNPWGFDQANGHSSGDPSDGIVVVSWNDFRHSMYEYDVN
jgi:hypothetical protein